MAECKRICPTEKNLKQLPETTKVKLKEKLASLKTEYDVNKGDTLGKIVQDRYGFLLDLDKGLGSGIQEVLLDQIQDRDPTKLDKDQILKFREIDSELASLLVEEPQAVSSDVEESPQKQFEKLPDGSIVILDDGIELNSVIPNNITYVRVTTSDGEKTVFIRYEDNFFTFNPDKKISSRGLELKKDMKLELLENFSEKQNLSAIRSLNEFHDKYPQIEVSEPLAVEEIGGRKVILRINALRSLKNAVAELRANSIEIDVNESFRTTEDQKRLKSKHQLLADLPNLSSHQTGGVIDLKLTSDDDKRRKFEEILTKHGFHRTFNSEPWHFEYIPSRKIGNERAYDTYKIIDGITDVPEDEVFRLIYDALRSIENDGERKYMSYAIYEGFKKFPNLPKNKETINLIIAVLHRESGLRQYPALSASALVEIVRLGSLVDNKDEFDKFLADRVNGDTWFPKTFIESVQSLDAYDAIYKVVKIAFDEWRAMLPGGRPQTEHDISKLRRLLKSGVEKYLAKNHQLVGGYLSSKFNSLLDKISPKSIGIGQINYRKFSTKLAKYLNLGISSGVSEEDLENYLYSIEGGVTAAILNVDELLAAQRSYGNTNVLDKIEFTIAEYNVGEFSCRNAFFQLAVNKLAEKYSLGLQIIEDGDLGQMTLSALSALIDENYIDLDEDQVEEDLKLQKQAEFSNTETYKGIITLYRKLFPTDEVAAQKIPQSFPKIKSQLDVSVKSYVGGTLLRLMSKLDYKLFEDVRNKYAKKHNLKVDQLNPEHYCDFWPDFKARYEKSQSNNISEVKDYSKEFVKISENTYSLEGRVIRAGGKDFHALTGAEFVAVQQSNPNYIKEYDNISEWRIAKWDPFRSNYFFVDHFNRPVRFLDNFKYQIRLEEKGVEEKFKPDTFITTKYGVEIYGQTITKTGDDFHRQFNYNKIAVNGLDADWDENRKNYIFKNGNIPLVFRGGNKYVIEDRGYLSKLEVKVKGDVQKLTEKIASLIEEGQLDLKEGESFIFVNKKSAKQYIIFAKMIGGNVEVLNFDITSTAQYEQNTPEGIYNVTRESTLEHWGKRFGLERNEYPYKLWDISVEGMGLAIHPTNHIEKLGTTASGGCARITFPFSRQIEGKVRRGTKVIIAEV